MHGRLTGAAKIERSGNQVKASRPCGLGAIGCGVHGQSTRIPAAWIKRQVRISGRPTSAVGSSLSIDSSTCDAQPFAFGASRAVVGRFRKQVGFNLFIREFAELDFDLREIHLRKAGH